MLDINLEVTQSYGYFTALFGSTFKWFTYVTVGNKHVLLSCNIGPLQTWQSVMSGSKNLMKLLRFENNRTP